MSYRAKRVAAAGNADGVAAGRVPLDSDSLKSLLVEAEHPLAA
jgi:hypothetical protein